MAIEERKHQLLNILRDKTFANTFELYREIGVSRATLHRYLCELGQENLIKQVRGGAIFTGKDENSFPALSDYESKEDLLYEERQRIGKASVELINDRESIILGTGRTTFALAKYLRAEKRRVYVFTPSLSIAFLLKDSSTCELAVPPGTSQGEEGYLVGPSTISSVKNLNCQKVFIGAAGITLENGITNFSSLIVEVEKELIKNGKEVVLLASHTKFDEASPYVIAPLNRINTVITTKDIPEKYVKYFKKHKIRTILA